jgi:hypothetical protein
LTHQTLLDDEATGLLVNKPTGKYKKERKEGTSFEAEGMLALLLLKSCCGYFAFI